MKLSHVGIVVDVNGGIAAGIKLFESFGYSVKLHVRRSEPWIGEMVGIPEADIEVVHLGKDGESVGIELLAYHYPTQRQGLQHLAYVVDDLDAEASKVCEYQPLKAPDVWSIPWSIPQMTRRGKAEIPDGPNKGTICGYLEGRNNIIIELIQKPKQ